MSFPEAERRVVHLLGNVLEENAVSTRSSDDPTYRVGLVKDVKEWRVENYARECHCLARRGAKVGHVNEDTG